MYSHKHQKLTGISASKRQRGAALLFIMFIVGLAVAAFTIKSFNVASMRAQQDEKTMQKLGEAKAALIAWAVSYQDLPGLMPYPNRGTDAAGYEDGGADCFAASTAFNYAFLIGMLPTKDTNDTNCIPLTRKGLPEFGVTVLRELPLTSIIDVTGNPLWYAVSRNLVRNYQSPAANPFINPGMVNVDVDALKSNPYDGTSTTSPYPWLIVRDINGNVISNRVAAVIIAPGHPLSGQSRTNTATPMHFLDQVIVGATTYSNRDYDQPDEDFVIGSNAMVSNTFNDRLIYITIDELIHAIEKRAAVTAKEALNDYRDNHGNFPYAAPLGVTSGYSCNGSSNAGLLPLDDGANCSFSFDVSTGTAAPPWWPSGWPWNPSLPWGVDEYTVSSSCSFDDVEKTIFTRSSGANYTAANQNCTFDGLTCSCSGMGSCSGSSIPTFSCDALGNCSSANHIDNENSGIDFEGGYFSSATNACSPIAPICVTGKGYPVHCSAGNTSTSGTFSKSCSEPQLTGLPDWFKSNRWQDYLYYRTSRGGSPLASGGKTGLSAILIGTGKPIVTPGIAVSKGGDQAHPSCEITDYLDSVENTNANEVFDPHYQPRNINYNDRIYIVAP